MKTTKRIFIVEVEWPDDAKRDDGRPDTAYIHNCILDPECDLWWHIKVTEVENQESIRKPS